MQTWVSGELPANTLVHGRYLVLRTIGRGGMGAVYEATDQRLGHSVALKQMLVSGLGPGQQPALEQAFEREARILAGLRHPALPKVTDHFSEASGRFLVMEYIPGDDLGALLSLGDGPFPIDAVLGWADQVLDALEYLHGQSPPILHRDIKPQNLKLTPDGQIVLLDFGLARGGAGAQAASVVGYTPTYGPLEQIQGAGSRPASDLYALAATIYQLLTSVAPPGALTRAAIRLSQQPDPLRPAHELRPAIPASLSAALGEALELDIERRTASAAAFRQALLGSARPPAGAATVLLLDPYLPPPQPTGPPAATPQPGGRARYMLIGAGLAGLLAVLAFMLFSRAGQPINAPPAGATPAPSAQALAAAPTRTSAPAATSAATPIPTTTPAPTSPPAATATPAATSATATPAFGPAAQQRPVRVEASGAAPDGIDSAGDPVSYAAENIADGQPGTTWRVAGDGQGAWLELAFAQPIQIREIQILPGYAKVDQADGTNRFTQNRRVRRVRLEFDSGQAIEATLADRAELQPIAAGGVVSTTVRIVILETTEPAAQNGRDFTPISEVVVIGAPQL